MKTFIMFLALLSFPFVKNFAQNMFESDLIHTSNGDLEITFIGHGSLMFQYNEMVVHVDPAGMFADYKNLPDADIILVTHQHGDHLDINTINELSTEGTELVLNEVSAKQIGKGTVIKNGESKVFKGLKVEAVPAYNIVNKRDNGAPFHPKGEGNGYVITFGDQRVYIAGDTENVPEMANLKGIEVAFIPMNLPYTMTPEMAADAVRMLNPGILYPYHFGQTDTNLLVNLLKDHSGTEIRIRKLN